MARLIPSTADDRSDAAAFAGRVTRWDRAGPVRLVADGQRVVMWAGTPFEVLATRAVDGSIHPSDVTVRAAELLAGLAISTATEVDPGGDVAGKWRAQLPPGTGWSDLGEVPVVRIAELVYSGTHAARSGSESPAIGAAHGSEEVPRELLDSPVLTVTGQSMTVTVPLRMLFALSGMGFAGDAEGETVRVRVSRTWLRLDARFGAVVRRRQAMLPLLV